MALFAPYGVGFQYLVWSMGGVHLTFMMSSITWSLTYSDWYSGVAGSWNGWLFLPNLWLFGLLLTDWQWVFTHVVLSSVILAFLTPLVRFLFVAAVLLYRTNRVGKHLLLISGGILLASTVAGCALSMILNAIYGVPPGLLISIAAPDVDVRFFCPIPILLITGLLLARKSCRVDDVTQMTDQIES
jgi:hypothetical protein